MKTSTKTTIRNLLLLVLLIATPIFIYSLLEYFPRYISWNLLTSQEIKEKAEDYSRNLPVCLYVIECSSGEPRLSLVKDIGSLDITGLKELIWKRRFYKYCEGATENIVLDFPIKVKQSQMISDARWSFYNDRFISNHGRFQGSYVSQYPWVPCTESIATLGTKNSR